MVGGTAQGWASGGQLNGYLTGTKAGGDIDRYGARDSGGRDSDAR
jgi:hypothetical protein